jgi:hypothetical protein
VFEFFYEACVANNTTDFCLGSLGRFQISWFLVNGSHFGEMGQLGFRPELMDISEVCSPNLMSFLIALGYVLTDRFKQAEKPRPRPFLVLPRYDRRDRWTSLLVLKDTNDTENFSDVLTGGDRESISYLPVGCSSPFMGDLG